MAYLFSNVLGSFVLNDECTLVIDAISFKSSEDYHKREAIEKKLKKKHPKIISLPEEKWAKAITLFKDKQYYTLFHSQNIQLSRELVKETVSEDLLIIQAIANINELDKASNLLVKRLREWYGLYLPEAGRRVTHHEKFVDLVLGKKREELLTELQLSERETMGKNLEKYHLEEIKQLAERVKELYDLRKHHELYLQGVMEKYCPNILGLAGTTIGARLVELARGLKHLAMIPASTVQLLGAEKALFRHIKTGSRSPKYGVIFSHPYIQRAKAKDRGKIARALADKLSLCARLDYFKGELKAPEYRKEIEERFAP